MVKVALVLGGGGIAGHAFHTAALGALLETTGWDPRTSEVIVGTSAGSGVASLLRGHVSIPAQLERLLALPTAPEDMARLREIAGRESGFMPRWSLGPQSPGLTIRELFRAHRARPMSMISGLMPAGRLATAPISEHTEELHKTWPDDALWITAVALGTGERVVFGRDDVAATTAEAVQASCAIPSFFAPVEIDGTRYIDGGVYSGTNADLVVEAKPDLAIISSPMTTSQMGLRAPVGSAMRLLPGHQLRNERRLLTKAGIPTLTLEPDLAVLRAMGPNPMDPTRIIPILVQASAAMTQSLRLKGNDKAVRILERAARQNPSPLDVPYPA